MVVVRAAALLSSEEDTPFCFCKVTGGPLSPPRPKTARSAYGTA